MADAHLSQVELVGWRDGGMGDRERIVAHLAACAACRRAAAELERDRPLEAGAEPTRFKAADFIAEGIRSGPTRPRVFGVPRAAAFLAAAATIVLALVLPSWLRETPETTLRSGAAVVTPSSPVDAVVAADALVFEWTAGPEAGALRLYVVSMDDAGAPIIDRDVTGTRYEPTAEERPRFRPGREYHWFVEYRGAGAVGGTSASARFRVQ